MGREVEKEHLKTVRWVIEACESGHSPPPEDVFRHIAMDHLEEDPEYYSKLQKLKL